eukprot:TRINITY_DN3585_c0_g1_i6.p1 TRINITY_DN3585_c0_g1~~TRINITY_DN3585_c0_g1_i6.p1  ORF type:complete len:231 (+),score=46.56 TRINITY_DN3585_c0_g1_i6:78-770(+)
MCIRDRYQRRVRGEGELSMVRRCQNLPSEAKIAEMKAEQDAYWAAQEPREADGMVYADIGLRYGYLSGTLTLSQPADRSARTTLSGVFKTGLHKGRTHTFTIEYQTYGGCPEDQKRPGHALGSVTPPMSDSPGPDGEETPFVFDFPITLACDAMLSGEDSILGDGAHGLRTVLRIDGYGSDTLKGATCHLIGRRLPPVEVLSTHSPLLDGVPDFKDIPAPECSGTMIGFD